MPWSEKQMRALRAKEHGAKLRRGLFAGISAQEAGDMADEGIDSRIGRTLKTMRAKHRVSRRMRGDGN